jgi:hypothetical protein
MMNLIGFRENGFSRIFPRQMSETAIVVSWRLRRSGHPKLEGNPVVHRLAITGSGPACQPQAEDDKGYQNCPSLGSGEFAAG